MAKNNQQKKNTKQGNNHGTKSWTMPKPPPEARPIPNSPKPKPSESPKPQSDKPKK